MNEKNICFCCEEEVYDDFVLICYDDVNYDDLDNYSVVCSECFEEEFTEDDYYIMHFGEHEIGYLPRNIVSEDVLESNPLFEKIKDEYYSIDFIKTSKRFTKDYLNDYQYVYIPDAIELVDFYGNTLGYTNVCEDELDDYGFYCSEHGWWTYDCPFMYPYHGYNKDKYEFSSIKGEEHPVYIGVEIETEGEIDNSEFVDENLFHCEYDGSLSSGFEMVSQPMTYSYWMKKYNEVQKLLETLKTNNQTADNECSCGLHIHISKDAFTNWESIVKAVSIVSGFQDNMVILSRREPNKYCTYEWVTDDGKIYKDIEISKERYRAVNVTNDDTIEFRMFQSTLNADILYASIELVMNIVNEANKDDDIVKFDDLLNGHFLKDYALGLKLDRTAKIKFEEED